MIFTPKTLNEAQGDGIPINWAARLIKTHRHWWRTEGAGVKIAILDSGINLEHPAFDGAIAKDGVWDFTVPDEESGGFWTPKKVKQLHGADKETKEHLCKNVIDDSGHGTHCAGIIAARSTTKDGMCGIAPQSTLYVAKVINGGKGNWESATEAIEWVLHLNKGLRKRNTQKIKDWEKFSAKEKAKPINLESEISIINMSFSGNMPTPEFYEVIHKALASGICIITAAGNEGARLGNGIGFPGKYGSVITVGSHDEFGTPSNFSSRGGEIDFLAPGYDVWSTDVTGHNISKKYHDFYQKRSGTSMAAPFVSGLAALIKSKHLSNSNSQTPVENCQDLYKHLIRMSAHPGYFDQESGYGPLLSFGNWDKIVNPQAPPLESSFIENYIYYRESEPFNERDDRVDATRVEDIDYIRNLQSSSSGGYWRNFEPQRLSKLFTLQSNQVGFMLDIHALKGSGGYIKDLKNGYFKIKTQTLEELITPMVEGKLCSSTRFKEQYYLPGRTVFYGGVRNMFISANHNLKVKPVQKKLPNFGVDYQRYCTKNYFLLFGPLIETTTRNEFLIESKSVLHPKHAIGSLDQAGDLKDWLVVYAQGKGALSGLLDQMDSLQRYYRRSKKIKKLLFRSEKPIVTYSNIDRFYAFGHPFGLPLKFIPDGEILDYRGYNTLDLFQGNSGSPIFDGQSLEIIGIHSAGMNSDVFVSQKQEKSACLDWNSTSTPDPYRYRSVFKDISPAKNVIAPFKKWVEKSNF